MKLRTLVALATLPLVLAACGDNNANVAAPAGQAPAAQPAAAAPAATSPAAAPSSAAGAAAASASGSDTEELGFLWGQWAADLAWCRDQTNGSPITITSERFEGAENDCAMSGVTDNGDGSYSTSLACQGEGQQTTEPLVMTPIFSPSGEGLVLRYPDRGGEATTLYRCS
ncbi:hypothetical protein SAMN02983003_0923 [Devosia enhydra]|uniref:Protease inhibitor Inh n=1 Tax=Devosia enhydra TaxID=665118 RepID=A0A1K2HUI2_9HYPH|nr:hypothetical protein [Devosia enhydra]SFZ82179.1 hypothetical protein SAMN02983003_0923 [Devosia enhydra]